MERHVLQYPELTDVRCCAGGPPDPEEAHPRAHRARGAQPLQGRVPGPPEEERPDQARGQGAGRCAAAASISPLLASQAA